MHHIGPSPRGQIHGPGTPRAHHVLGHAHAHVHIHHGSSGSAGPTWPTLTHRRHLGVHHPAALHLGSTPHVGRHALTPICRVVTLHLGWVATHHVLGHHLSGAPGPVGLPTHLPGHLPTHRAPHAHHTHLAHGVFGVLHSVFVLVKCGFEVFGG